MDFDELLKNQCNAKSIKVTEIVDGVKTTIKAEYGKLGADYKELAPKVIAQLVQLSPEKILQSLKAKGMYEMKLGKETVNISEAHVAFERHVPANLAEAESPFGMVYLNKERTRELDAEGFARELMRRVQELRKKSGLVKSDRIDLAISTDKELSEMLAPLTPR